MEPQALLLAIEKLASRLCIDVRQVPLGGDGGGLCVLKGHRVLFVDSSADSLTQCDRSLTALAQIPEIDTVYIEPVLRELLLRSRSGD